jgi:hypothetical protein
VTKSKLQQIIDDIPVHLEEAIRKAKVGMQAAARRERKAAEEPLDDVEHDIHALHKRGFENLTDAQKNAVNAQLKAWGMGTEEERDAIKAVMNRVRHQTRYCNLLSKSEWKAILALTQQEGGPIHDVAVNKLRIWTRDIEVSPESVNARFE